DPGECSRWWYHRASFKDCEADPIFNRMIALFTILKIAEERNIRDIVLVGAPAEFAVALKTAFRVRSLSKSAFGLASACARSLASRFAFGLKTAYECWLARRQPASRKFDVALSGFWQWSMGTRYFGELPEAIKSESDRSVGWLAWMDDHVVLSKENHPVVL